MTRTPPPAPRGTVTVPPHGQGVDFLGNPVIDPTANVIALNEAAVRRQDDLREKDREISDLQHAHTKELLLLRAQLETQIATMREDFQNKLLHAEAGRLDSIRQVDREDVAKATTAANLAISTLAAQTTDVATTLQKQVSDTALAAEARSSAQYNDTTKRLQAIELALSEGKGKQTVVDPQMDKLQGLVEAMARTQSTNTGKSEGISSTVAILLAVGGLIVALIGAPLMARLTAPTPQVIYAPPSPGGFNPSGGGTETDTRSTTRPR